VGNFKWFVGVLLGSLLLGACGAEQTKEDVADIPFDGNYDGKADSWRFPRDGGTILVGQAVVADFDEVNGWIGYEVELRAGLVDVDLSDALAGSDSPLDTLLLVYGPRRADGSYPSRPAAVNDDYVPGETLNSHILFDAPADGIYRVVASTYYNWVYWPYNVSTGTYQLIVRCPRIDDEGPLACGPHEGFDDVEWVTSMPTRCMNPWDDTVEDEIGEIVKYFDNLGIHVVEIGLIRPEHLVLCPECFCPRGDRLLMKVSSADAATLVAEHGFDVARTVAKPWLTYAPIQCGNPWEPVDGDLLDDVTAWATDAGAAPGNIGFVNKTAIEPRCLACPCARGDRLVATPAEGTDAAPLVGLGFSSLY